MVRLKHISIPALKEGRVGLNSTMVRLKLIYSLIMEVNMKRSQFHYGSIKTKQQQFSIDANKKSQFHYGSIKTIIKF